VRFNCMIRCGNPLFGPLWLYYDFSPRWFSSSSTPSSGDVCSVTFPSMKLRLPIRAPIIPPLSSPSHPSRGTPLVLLDHERFVRKPWFSALCHLSVPLDPDAVVFFNFPPSDGRLFYSSLFSTPQPPGNNCFFSFQLPPLSPRRGSVVPLIGIFSSC